ncbi:MAG: shikimate kinase [Candidatus Eremiobacteraeota bacterium]|nr:shikimate kinase [Candidatus Eremiobacteraeota bacterium]
MKKNIYLAGFMGTGKSTVGKELARLLGRKFIDMDSVLEKRLGMKIPEIFEKHGEDYFRKEEKKLAMELAGTHNKVIATGGGSILDLEVREAFRSSGLIIGLEAQENELVNRLSRTGKRPLVKDRKTIPRRVKELLEEREPVYKQITIRVNTTNLTPKEAASKIVDLLKTRQRILDQLQSQYITLS